MNMWFGWVVARLRARRFFGCKRRPKGAWPARGPKTVPGIGASGSEADRHFSSERGEEADRRVPSPSGRILLHQLETRTAPSERPCFGALMVRMRKPEDGRRIDPL